MAEAETRLKALMAAAQAGDAAAYRALLGALCPHLRAYYARRLGSARADAEDLVQETLIAIHTRRATYDARAPFTPWLHAIARYKLIDHFRRARLRRTLPLEAAEAVLGESDGEAASARRDVEQLLARLPEKPRAAIRHTKLEGLSVEEAARLTGQSETALKVSVHRGLKALTALIAERRRP